MRRALFSTLVAAFALSACGAPKAGDTCDQTGFLCADTTSAIECRGGKWLTLPCRGANGCSRQANLIKCDMSANTAGDGCASTAEGKGICTTDGKGTLECREGTLVKTNTCSSCVVSNDQVICQP